MRTAPQAAGCAVGGAVAMVRRARPHTNGRPWALPPQLPPTGYSSHSFLQLPSPLGRAPSAHALHSDPESLVPGRYCFIFPSSRSSQAQW